VTKQLNVEVEGASHPLLLVGGSLEIEGMTRRKMMVTVLSPDCANPLPLDFELAPQSGLADCPMGVETDRLAPVGHFHADVGSRDL